MKTFLTDSLNKIEKEGLSRTLRLLESAPDSVVITDRKRVIQFSSNNYLGLANHPVLKQAAREALEEYGLGSGASRLIAGNFELYERLERRLAKFKGTEAALVFPSGYQTNIGAISTLMGPGDIIFSDALNHASIIDGCRLSGARVVIYPHRDLNSLKKIIQQSPEAPKKLIVTDSVFSMDGTLAPLPGLAALAKSFGCWLMVDEAHATGIFGRKGAGTAEHFGLEEKIDIQMGTFSKAFGSLGGYIAGSHCLINFFINSCRNIIYTTGLPPAVLSANQAAIDLVEKNSELREQLWERVKFFRNELNRIGFDTLQSETQIIPILTREPSLTMKFSRYLFEKGILAQGIRPPTVAEGLCRIRVSIMATHSWKDISYGLKILEEAGKTFGII